MSWFEVVKLQEEYASTLHKFLGDIIPPMMEIKKMMYLIEPEEGHDPAFKKIHISIDKAWKEFEETLIQLQDYKEQVKESNKKMQEELQ
tara:strand:+ start:4684 stop:4950 length:267 start_codon:yes stop_codon:yes gene_type:complete